MATQGVTDWKKEWFEIEDATYLNTAAHTVIPACVHPRGRTLARSKEVSPIVLTIPCGSSRQFESVALWRG